jgi:hypothetical protein
MMTSQYKISIQVYKGEVTTQDVKKKNLLDYEFVSSSI